MVQLVRELTLVNRAQLLEYHFILCSSYRAEHPNVPRQPLTEVPSVQSARHVSLTAWASPR